MTSANIVPNFAFERSTQQVMRASCSKIPNAMLGAAKCSYVSILFIYLFTIRINTILLYTSNLPNTSFPSSFNISGATDYPNTRPEEHRHVTLTPKCVSFRSDAKSTASATVGSVGQTFFLIGATPLCCNKCNNLLRQ